MIKELKESLLDGHRKTNILIYLVDYNSFIYSKDNR